MRITRESLLRVVQDTVAQRTRSDRSILAIYLCGSMLDEECLLGGTTDLDLVLIHMDQVSAVREIVPLTDEIHLDIAHHFHRDYRQTRQLRVHPWLGPTLKGCRILYDPQHFLDFTQASVRGQFERTDHVLERARSEYEESRQIWTQFHLNPVADHPSQVRNYLKALAAAANAIASLSGSPLSERRFLAYFPARAEFTGRPGLYPGLLGLLGAPRLDPGLVKSWLGSWQKSFPTTMAEGLPIRIHPARRLYYQKAIESQVDSAQPMIALWPLFNTWAQSAAVHPDSSPERQAWMEAMQRAGLVGESFPERVQALDIYLDQIDETLELWAQRG